MTRARRGRASAPEVFRILRVDRSKGSMQNAGNIDGAEQNAEVFEGDFLHHDDLEQKTAEKPRFAMDRWRGLRASVEATFRRFGRVHSGDPMTHCRGEYRR